MISPWELAGYLLGGLAVTYAAIGVMALALRLMPPPPPAPRRPEPEHPLDVLDELLSGGGASHSPEASAPGGRRPARQSPGATQGPPTP